MDPGIQMNSMNLYDPSLEPWYPCFPPPCLGKPLGRSLRRPSVLHGAREIFSLIPPSPITLHSRCRVHMWRSEFWDEFFSCSACLCVWILWLFLDGKDGPTLGSNSQIPASTAVREGENVTQGRPHGVDIEVLAIFFSQFDR